MEGAIVMRGPSTFGLPPKEAPGSILRRQACPFILLAVTCHTMQSRHQMLPVDTPHHVEPCVHATLANTSRASVRSACEACVCCSIAGLMATGT